MLLGGICTVIVLDFIEVHESGKKKSLLENLACGSEWKTSRQAGKAHINEPGITKHALVHLYDRE